MVEPGRKGGMMMDLRHRTPDYKGGVHVPRRERWRWRDDVVRFGKRRRHHQSQGLTLVFYVGDLVISGC